MKLPAPTNRLILREWHDEDLPPYSRMNSDPAVMEYFPSILTEAESLAHINKIRKQFTATEFGLYAAELKATGEFIGFIGFSVPAFESFFTPCVEIGWRLAKSYWGRGLATEGARACLHFGFTQLGFSEIYSWTPSLNLRSSRVMQKTGMQFVQVFEHPLIAQGHPLREHVLYKSLPGGT